MQNLILAGMLVVLSSCTMGSYVYLKPDNVTQDQFDRDKAFCEMEANKTMAVASNKPDSTINYESIFDPCMRSKGFKQTWQDPPK